MLWDHDVFEGIYVFYIDLLCSTFFGRRKNYDFFNVDEKDKEGVYVFCTDKISEVSLTYFFV